MFKFIKEPSPIEQITPNIYVKRDDLLGEEYGGNKVRKLEKILYDAKDHKTFLSFGGIGSNYTVACSCYCKKVGLRPVFVVIDQPETEHTKKNPEMVEKYGGTLYFSPNYFTAIFTTIRVYFKYWLKDKKRPYIIRPGGATALGSSGYINCVDEFKDDIQKYGIKTIYLAVGSCGTISGILAGIAIHNLDVNVIGVKVVEKYIVNRPHINYLTKKILKLAGHPNKKVPRYTITNDFFGGEYGAITKKSKDAVKKAKQYGLTLEPVYTGKCFACIMRDLKNWKENVLFINTYSSKE